MNDELKAYLDGELSPAEAEQVAIRLERDRQMARDAQAFEHLSQSLRRLPGPEPVGQAATLLALRSARRRQRHLVRQWAYALTACVVVSVVGARLSVRPAPVLQPAGYSTSTHAPETSVELPAGQLKAFSQFVKRLGGSTRWTGGTLKAFYSDGDHVQLLEKFGFDPSTPYDSTGLSVLVGD